MAENTPNKEELFRLAKDALSQGQAQPARIMFQQILQQDKRDVRAMMYMAKLASSQSDRAMWLERVLKVQPNNETARAALSKIQGNTQGKRNRLILNIGTLVYVVALTLICLLVILSSA